MKYNVENYTPLEGKLLIKPLRQRTRTVENIVMDDEKNKDKDPMKDEMETKVVKEKAPYEIQLAEVVAVHPNSKYNVGDTIVYSVKFVKDFDMFKNVYLVSDYDLYGTYEL